MVEHTAVIVPDGLTFLVEIVAPVIVPFSVLLGKLPGHKGVGSLKVFPQRKAPAIIEQDKLMDHITLIFFQSSTSLKAGASGQIVPKYHDTDVDSIRAKHGQAISNYGPPQKRPRKALIQAGFAGPNCQRSSPVFSAYIPAVGGGGPSLHRPPNSKPAAHPGEQARRTPGTP